MSNENRSMDRKVVFEPYDMDTGLGTNNSGVLMFSPYLEDTDTVSNVIAGGESGGSEAPVYNAQDSVMWNNLRDAFRSELVQMYRTLRASNGPWQYAAIEKRFEDHQAYWPEAIFNEDAWVKYIIPLVDPVTVDDDTGELIRTDRYLTMLQGSKKEQRKWWLYNRFRYLDSKYDTGNASSNIINIRFFNGGTLRLKTAIPMYAAVSFGGGTTPEIKRTEANTEVSFTYTPGTGVTEMETWIHSGNLITDVGDLSVFYPNECDFSKASLLRRLKIGDSTSGYSNANLTTINVTNSPLLEYIDCRNCPRLGITVDLENSPRLAEAYFDGTSITGLELADGCAIETLHLPATVTTLTLLNLSKLEEFVIPSYANIARFMFNNIDTTIVNPVSVLSAIQPNSQVNIQGLYLALDDAEAIGEFFDLVDTMSGVTREKSSLTGEWIYHEEEKAVISGEVHTEYLTGDDIEVLNSRYPYVRTTADHITTTLKYYNWDGSTLLETQTIIDGGDGTYSETPARADDADWRYTFIGWNIQPDKYVADPNATLAVNQNRSVYAAYSRTSIAVLKYYTYDGSELLYSETIIGGGNGTWAGAPTRPSDPRYTYTFAGWSSVPNGQADANIRNNVTMHKSIYAAYTAEGQKYTVTFKSESGTVLQTVNNVLYGGTATFTGTVPAKTGVEDPEMYEFIGWNPSNTNIQGNTTCYPVYKYNGIKFYKILDKTIAGDYENSLPTEVRPYAFCSCGSLETITFPSATSIGVSAFGNCAALKSVSLPLATSIGGSAFLYCTALQSISLPVATSIGTQAFQYCFALQSISLPAATYIGDYAFAYCSAFQSISLPLATSIGGSAFYACYALQSVSLPAAIRIGSSAFQYCSALQSISLPAATSIGAQAFAFCYTLQSISLPAATSIDAGAFYNCYAFQSISLPSATNIGQNAFLNCTALQSVSLPAATSIFSGAFSNCRILQSISLPAVTSIWQNVFNGCNNLRAIFLSGTSVVTLSNSNAFSSTHKWLSIFVPDSLVTAYQSANNWSYYSSRIFGITSYSGLSDGITVTDVSGNYSGNTEIFYINDPSATSIGQYAFYNCTALQSVNLPLVTSIGTQAFQYCSALQSISLPAATSIGDYAFAYCDALQSISLPAVTYIGTLALVSCHALQSVNLPAVTSIGQYAFYNCYAFQSISLPSATSIDAGAFYNCVALQSVSLPAATIIGSDAFYGCYNLRAIFLSGTSVVTLSNSNAFSSTHKWLSIFVPDSLVTAYQSANNWSYYSSRIFGI